MSRKLKFRAWDKNGAVMIYPSPLMNPLYLTLKGNLVEIDREGEESPAHGYEVTRFTGLFDRHGADIYEGDVLFHSDFLDKYEVYWGDSGWRIRNSVGHSCALQSACKPNVEVVGNIFGNKSE